MKKTTTAPAEKLRVTENAVKASTSVKFGEIPQPASGADERMYN